MTAAGIYVRISSDRLAEGLGVERQERECRALAKRKGWRVEEVYVDNDVSAYSRKPRPSYKRLMADVEAGRIQAIAAWHPDRLYRRITDLSALVEIVEGHQIEIATVTAGDNLDLSTASGRLQAGIFGQLAEYESAHKSERVRAKHVELAQQGKRSGGGPLPPFGYRFVDDAGKQGLALDDEQAARLRQAADHIIDGGSMHRLVAEWNTEGYATPAGKRWTINDIRRVLTRAVIAGIREHHSKNGTRKLTLVGTYEGTWPAIISPDELETVRTLLKQASRGSKSFGHAGRKHVLTGVVYCGRCGQPMSGRRFGGRDKGSGYSCNTVKGGCAKVAIAAHRVEDYILDFLAVRDPRMSEKPVQTKQVVAPDRETLAALARIRARRTTLAEAAALGADVAVAAAKLDAEEAALQASLVVPIEASVDPEKEDPGRRQRRHDGLLTKAEVVQTHEWIKAWIDKVIIAPATKRDGKTWTRQPIAERVTIQWRAR